MLLFVLVTLLDYWFYFKNERLSRKFAIVFVFSRPKLLDIYYPNLRHTITVYRCNRCGMWCIKSCIKISDKDSVIFLDKNTVLLEDNCNIYLYRVRINSVTYLILSLFYNINNLINDREIQLSKLVDGECWARTQSRRSV